MNLNVIKEINKQILQFIIKLLKEDKFQSKVII